MKTTKFVVYAKVEDWRNRNNPREHTELVGTYDSLDEAREARDEHSREYIEWAARYEIKVEDFEVVELAWHMVPV